MIRIGQGYDIHTVVSGRPLIIGGVKIPYPYGLHGHSDADPLLHAIKDALLGALALGDIGHHFPDTDARFAGASSLDLLHLVAQKVRAQAYEISNIDTTIIAQAPKLAPFIPLMRENIAHCLAIQKHQISVKAKTHEGCDAIGRKEAIAAQAIVLLSRVQ